MIVKAALCLLDKGIEQAINFFFTITNSSFKSPTDEDMITNEAGQKIASNILLVYLKTDFFNNSEAQRIADDTGGIIVGYDPSTLLFQIQFSSIKLEALKNIKKVVEDDPAVDFCMIDYTISSQEADWSDDDDFYGQRATNKVEEGAKFYTDNVSPTDATKLHPNFTSIGVIENGLDFDASDFDGYSANGSDRSNNIALYSTDTSSSTDHGSTVTGIIAAEIGDGKTKTGKNAGLLQGLERNHGGFNIAVKKSGSTWGDAFNSTIELVKSGATVINWSFGTGQEGAPNKDGDDICCDACDNACIDKEGFIDLRDNIEKWIKNKIEKDYPNVIIVAAAGNTHSWAKFWVPSSIQTDSLIIVGAHENLPWYWPFSSIPEIADFSNIGPEVDIVACGKYVKDSKGNEAQGTSFAAPLVTATIAAMQSVNPDLTPDEIRKLLRKSSLPVDPEVETNGVTPNEPTRILSIANGEVRDDGKCFYNTGLDCEGKSARLNVQGALEAAVDSLEDKTIPIGDKVDVTLPKNTSVLVPVQVTVPSDDVFDKVDIIFMVDVSGSYGDDIAQFKSKAIDLVNAFNSAGRNVQIGLTSFSDFPWSPYGSSSYGDYAYRLDQMLTSDSSEIISSINNLSLHYGMDGPESQLEALYQAATGIGRTVSSYGYTIESSDVGWREGALPVIFLATDYSFHKESSYPGASWDETVTALNDLKIRVYGLQSGGNISDVINMAAATDGDTFLLSRNSAEIVDAVIAALEGAASQIDVKLVPNGDFADLVQSISPEKHEDVSPGDTITFDVQFTRSLALDSGVDHVFAFRLEVIAEDVATIMEIPVTVSIPAE
ncbi:S8 family serine peptidase [Desulfosarcina cetonica]|uniref:S8 family serine peptidase n=1 Tax=Desulfosarcina cetonica TaxID=90730 RepID=UPI00155DC15E|nr:S8 family serine peptidase [Desulfosarcina cetonica]